MADSICPAEHDDGEHLWACQGFTGHDGDHRHQHGAWVVYWNSEGSSIWMYDMRKVFRNV